MHQYFAVYPSPIGYIRIEHNGNRLTSLQILEGEPTHFGESDTLSDNIFSQIEEYLRGERREFDVAIEIPHATPFQRSVWEHLRHIPYGQTQSYAEVAHAIHNPKAARAVGSANNRNPIHIIIPCHRIVGARGALVGYAAGVETKAFLLNLEKIYG